MAQKTSLEVKTVLQTQQINIFLPMGTKPVSSKDDLTKYAEFKHNTFNLLPYSGVKDGNLNWIESNLPDSSNKITVDKSGTITIQYSAFYISVNRYTELKVKIKSQATNVISVDNSLFLKEIDKNKTDCTYKIALETGIHLLRIKSVSPVETESNPITGISVEAEVEQNCIDISLAPKNYPTFAQLLNDPKINTVNMSSKGNYAIVTIAKYDFNEKKTVTLIQLIDVKKHNVLQTLNAKMYGNIKWIPNSDKFSFQTMANQVTTIYSYDVTSGKQSILLENLKDFYSARWDDSGKILYYTTAKDKTQYIDGLKRHQSINDKVPGDKGTTSIFSYNTETCFTTELISSQKKIDVYEISPKNDFLIYLTDSVDYSKRPYVFSTVKLLNLKSFEEKSIGVYSRCRSISFIDSDRLLVLGNSSMYDKPTKKKSNPILNEYNIIPFMYSISEGTATKLITDFKPELSDINLVNNGKTAYYLVTEGQYKNIYRHDIEKGTVDKVHVPCEVVTSFSFSADGKQGILVGSSVSTPSKVFLYDVESMKFTEFIALPTDQVELTLPKTKDLKIKNKSNQEIETLIYYPLNYDATKKYPCIVYYYGGVTPVTRDYEGRYPKNIWAANGYFVLVVIPRGSVGYGQEFADNHVNDWGEKTSDDIMEAVKQFLGETPQVDKNAVGCIGASYGGFMTLTLVEKSDLFSAAISHAGISNLSSYWGVGYWGVDYSTVATAESFPWNRQDIYVNKSPLFSAEKVKTPLMLLHGNSDTNVPVGESYQFYAALKLLGKDVELIEVEGENHHILEHDKRERWSKIILAYFDKYLKKQPEWWNSFFEKK